MRLVTSFCLFSGFVLFAVGCVPTSPAKTTLLHKAVRKGDIEQVRSLISSGADVNATDRKGKTPLSYSKEKGHREIIELLRRHGAKE